MRKFIVFYFLLSFVFQLKATNHVVTSSEDDPLSPTVGMLRYAIENASNGDTITFAVSTVNLDTALRINGGTLTIDGRSGVIIDGNNKDRIFNISCYSSSDKITINNITVQNGNIDDASAMGGGMYAYILSGSLIVENCTFKDNTITSSADGQGGALRTYGGTFRNCFFLNNTVTGTATARGGGAVYSIGGTFINCVIAGNSAKYGGGVYSSTSSEYINCTITQNSATNTSAGGGVSCEDNCTFTNSIIYNNQSNGTENNIDNYLGTSTFSYCAVEDGNPISGTNNNIGLTTTPFTHSGEDSLSLYQGSACENAGTTSGITVLSEDIIGNDRIYDSNIDIGAYEYNEPRYDAITVTNNSFDPAVEYSLPWAIEHADSSCIITFDNNYHIDLTGGIYLDESITIDGSGYLIELDGNSNYRVITISGTDGDTITLKNLFIQNGASSGSGGGLSSFTSNDMHINLINCVFENNFTDVTGGQGGGIYIRCSSAITNCTFYKNKSDSKGGAAYTEDATFTNCIFYANEARENIELEGTAVFKHCAATSMLTGENNIRLWTNPFIGGTGSDRLQLIKDSYCSNVGTPDISRLNLPLVDLAGNLRIQNDTIDLGAFESNYLSTPIELYKSIVVTNNSFDAGIDNSLPWAIAHADDSCLITFNNDYTINFTSEIELGNKSLTIDGGANQIVFDGGDSTQFFIYNGKSTSVIQFKSLTFQNGYSRSQGGALNININTGGNFVITSCLFKENSAVYGGAIYIKPILSGTEGVSIYNSVFINNYSDYSGGALYSNTSSGYWSGKGNIFVNCTFADNKSRVESGGIYSSGESDFINCLFYNNTSANGDDVKIVYGDIIKYCAADAALQGSNNIRLYTSPFEGNSYQLNSNSYCSNAGTPSTSGLSLPDYDLAGNNRIQNDTIDIGAYESSYYKNAPLEYFDTITVTNNSSNVLVEKSFFWALAHIKDNGLILFDGDYAINVTSKIVLGDKNLTIDGGTNRIVLDGGDSIRIFKFDYSYNDPRSIKLKNLTIQHGYSEIYGGGLYSEGNARLDVINCLFYKNSAKFGGGVYSDGYDRFYNCIFIGNYASDSGGGSYTSWNSKLINCSLSNNYSEEEGGGSIVYYSEMVNCLAYGNFSGSGKNDVHNRGGSIIKYTASGNDLSSFSASNILLTENPFNGTSLYDSLMIGQDSELINAGSPDTTGLNLPDTEFRLKSRIAGDTIDIGAYEYFDHTISSSVNNYGRIIPATAHILNGRNQKFRIIPDTGCSFDSLWVDNVYVDSINTYTFYNVTTNHEIRAMFKPDTFNIKTIIGENGMTTFGDTNITYFESVQYAIKPDIGYKIDSASFGKTSIISDLIKIDDYFTYTIDSLLSDDTLYVTFCQDTFKISTVIHGGGEISPMNFSTTYFDTTNIIITPNWGHHILNAKFSGNNILNELVEFDGYYGYTIQDILKDDTLEISFVVDTCHVQTVIEGEGTVSPSDTSLAFGEFLTLYIYPKSNILTMDYDGEYDDYTIWDQNDTTVMYILYYVRSDGTLNVKFKENTTGIANTLKDKEASLYPNPTTGNINFKLPDNISEFKLLIVDNNGRTLFNNPKYNKHHFDLSSYPPGNYLVIIEYSNKMFSFPVIKQ